MHAGIDCGESLWRPGRPASAVALLHRWRMRNAVEGRISPENWDVPASRPVCEALSRGMGARGAWRDLGAQRVDAGVSWEDACHDLAVLYAAVAGPQAVLDPAGVPEVAQRGLALGWVRHIAADDTPGTTQLRQRLAEVYRLGAEQVAGQRLVVFRIAGMDDAACGGPTGWETVVGQVVPDGEPVTLPAQRSIVILAPWDEHLATRVTAARRRLRRMVAAAAPAVVPLVHGWVQRLPVNYGEACERLAALGGE